TNNDSYIQIEHTPKQETVSTEVNEDSDEQTADNVDKSPIYASSNTGNIKVVYNAESAPVKEENRQELNKKEAQKSEQIKEENQTPLEKLKAYMDNTVYANEEPEPIQAQATFDTEKKETITTIPARKVATANTKTVPK